MGEDNKVGSNECNSQLLKKGKDTEAWMGRADKSREGGAAFTEAFTMILLSSSIVKRLQGLYNKYQGIDSDSHG